MILGSKARRSGKVEAGFQEFEEGGSMEEWMKKENFKNWNLSPSELSAIMVHKYLLSKNLNREVPIEEAIADFLERYMEDFHKEQVRLQNQRQLDEINKYRWIESEKAGRDIGIENAAQDWRAKYAAIYREESEALGKNNFLTLETTVMNRDGIHVRPAGTLATLAAKYDADVYVSKEGGMDHYNFVLQGKPYINFKSIMINLLTINAAQGAKLTFIAYGKQAAEVLEEIKKLMEARFGEKI